MPFPITIYVNPEGFYEAPQPIILYGGLTALIGPNGSGKTQIMRKAREQLDGHVDGKKVRYLSAGRLASLENYRSNFNGYQTTPNYDGAQFGPKDWTVKRHLMETASGDFFTLSVRPDLQIVVGERLRRLFKRELYIDWDAGNLTVKFKRLDNGSSSYSSAREASGLLQLVAVLAAIYDDEVGALLIDEPEVSLHPQFQSFLFKEMQNVAGDPSVNPRKKIIIYATHSPEMINLQKPSDLCNVLFFTAVSIPPIQVSPDRGELRNRQLESLFARLGHSHKAAFFSSRPILVEGVSDEIICNALDRYLDLNLSAAGAQVIPVIGKGQIPTVMKLLTLIGKSPVVITDLDTIADDKTIVSLYVGNTEVEKEVQESGHSSLSEFASRLYSDFTRFVETNWADIESVATQHYYWVNRDESKSEVQAKRRATMAVLMSTDEVDISGWSSADTVWLPVRRRLTLLFNILEFAGCFILRRGTIESYYSNVTSSPEKPVAAVEEVELLSSADPDLIEAQYADVVRGLKFAAQLTEIDEAAAVHDLLLSIVAPALGRLTRETTDWELSALTQQILGDRAKLFEITKVQSGDGDPLVKIDLKSSVLRVTGFPLTMDSTTNPIQKVKADVRTTK